MKKNLILLTAAYVLVSLLTACNSEKAPVTVFLNSTFINEHKVFLNDTTLLKTNATESYVELLIPAGRNTVTIDGIKDTFNISKSGGILNVAKEGFYLYPIEYTSEQSFNLSSLSYTAPVIFNSMVVYDKKIAKNQEELLNFLKDPNKKRLVSGRSKKINSDELYIAKRWDLGIEEEIPEQLEMTSSSVTLSKVIRGTYFLLASQLSEEYIVETIENEELIEIINNLSSK